MPGFNRKGPRDQGAMTGRGLGKCKNNNQNSETQVENDDFPRRRFRFWRNNRGFGFGRRGRRNDDLIND